MQFLDKGPRARNDLRDLRLRRAAHVEHQARKHRHTRALQNRRLGLRRQSRRVLLDDEVTIPRVARARQPRHRPTQTVIHDQERRHRARSGLSGAPFDEPGHGTRAVWRVDVVHAVRDETRREVSDLHAEVRAGDDAAKAFVAPAGATRPEQPRQLRVTDERNGDGQRLGEGQAIRLEPIHWGVRGVPGRSSPGGLGDGDGRGHSDRARRDGERQALQGNRCSGRTDHRGRRGPHATVADRATPSCGATACRSACIPATGRWAPARFSTGCGPTTCRDAPTRSATAASPPTKRDAPACSAPPCGRTALTLSQRRTISLAGLHPARAAKTGACLGLTGRADLLWPARTGDDGQDQEDDEAAKHGIPLATRFVRPFQ